MLIYMVTGWRYEDGITRSYLFSTEDRRKKFLDGVEERFNWEYQWSQSEKTLDSHINDCDDFS